jgi:alanyl-tRNA synthetase
VLGEHVSQKGSLVDPDKLRFDFSHFEPVSPEELREIEHQVNEQILGNTPVQTELTDMEQAQSKGAMALFGEKYGDEVRVLSMGSDRYSVELCGGTHVSRTGDIGLFRITSESGISSGVRRIEAVTGFGALEWLNDTENTLRETAKLVKATRDTVVHFATALSQSDVNPVGWAAEPELSFAYTDTGRTRMNVFTRALKAGDEMEIPQGNWTGGLLLLPHAPEKQEP